MLYGAQLSLVFAAWAFGLSILIPEKQNYGVEKKG